MTPLAPDQEGWEGPREGGRRRRLLLLVGGFALALLLVSLSGDGSLIRIYRLTRQRASLLQDIERLRAENARLRREVGALQQDETRLEEIARRKLGLVRPGEVVYRFAPPPGAPAEEGDSPAAW
ncbi:MAG TPA: septum formation initiator family protein [Candidatus Methylomirabilis sp.]|nr:septum formation initiator family protein [Candidatus Methylomirabilis sp.]